jgi:2,4-dienoyl-CoA reductase-like NADH-dependent reductase (Old Yellow Enzyme family)/thioredoxin reductase
LNNYKLLEPFKLGPLQLRNRFVMAPMCTRLARPDGSVTHKMIDYYTERAKGGVGLIIIEYSYLDEAESKAAISQLGVQNDHMITGLSDLAEAIHAEGASTVLQICHAGNQTTPFMMGLQPVAPSAVPCQFLGVMPRELDLDEIELIQDSFAEAARRAKQAGFDGVELHGAHGYLMDQFLSPITNKRTDVYGGALENRALFALETLQRVKEKVGEGFVVGYRMSADEFMPDGLRIEETVMFAGLLSAAGVDYVNVTAGVYDSLPEFIQPVYVPRAYLVPYAAAVKKEVSVPVLTVGSLNVDEGEQALKEGKADLVAFGRALIADPYLPRKLAEGKKDDIRPCIRGNEGCLSRFFTGQTIRCEVNPQCGREKDFKITPAATKKTVVVIGGGPAGLEAARVLALRGHKVTLFEKNQALGGHMLESTVPSFKWDVKQLFDWLLRQVNQAGVEVKLGVEATADQVKTLNPDAVIVAAGSEPTTLMVPTENMNVTTAVDVLVGKQAVGDKIVIIGGGLVGCETALYIFEQFKKQPVIVEMLDKILVDMEPVSSIALTQKLLDADIEVHTGWHLTEIKAGKVICSDAVWQKHEIEADTVVSAVGFKPKSNVEKDFAGVAPVVCAVGDCVEPRKIYNAFEEAWRVALQI